jgi:hypothetical protein
LTGFLRNFLCASMTLKSREFFHRLIPVVLAQTAGLACGVIGVRLSSRFVPPEVLGEYGIFLSFTTLGMWVIHAGLVKYVSRHWAATESKPAMLRQMVRLWTEKLPWLVLSSAGAAWAIARLTGHSTWGLLLLLLFISGVLSLVSMGQTALQVNREHWTDFRISATGSLTRTFLPLIFFITLGSATGLYAGLTLHILICISMVAWAFRTHWALPGQSARPKHEVGEIYTGQYFTALASAGWALSGINRWVVAGFFGNVEAGFITLAGNIAVVVPIFAGTVITQLFQAGLFAMGDSIANGNRRQLLRRVDAISAAFCVLSIPGILVLNSILPWLIGPLIHFNYNAALHWVLPVGLFGTAMIVGQYYHTLLLAARLEKSCAPVDLANAGILIGGSVLAATGGKEIFTSWLLFTPLIPWIVTRTLARRSLLKAKVSPQNIAGQ